VGTPVPRRDVRERRVQENAVADRLGDLACATIMALATRLAFGLLGRDI
jgi:hypothetical protein